MGYESKLYVVDKHKFNDSYIWGEVIAMYDLCKVPDVSCKMRKYPATDCFIYADDGNTEITEDRYGDTMKEIPVADAIRIIENAIERDPHYRRYNPCLQLLKGFDLDDWGNLVVLHFGH